MLPTPAVSLLEPTHQSSLAERDELAVLVEALHGTGVLQHSLWVEEEGGEKSEPGPQAARPREECKM